MKRKNNTSLEISPEEAVEFLESFQRMLSDQDEPSIAISIRVPANILKALKTTAKLHKKKYQSLLLEYVREGLKRDNP